MGPKGSEMEENEVKKIKQLFKKEDRTGAGGGHDTVRPAGGPRYRLRPSGQRSHSITAMTGNGNTIRYQQTVSHDGITCGHAERQNPDLCRRGRTAYCIEPGISLHTGNTLEKDASVAWHNLGKEKQDAVNLALLYGAQGSMGSLSGTEDEKVLATQMVIWEIVTGCRNATAPYAPDRRQIL